MTFSHFFSQKFCIASQLLATLFMKQLILIEIFKVNMNDEWERCSGHTKKIERLKGSSHQEVCMNVVCTFNLGLFYWNNIRWTFELIHLQYIIYRASEIRVSDLEEKLKTLEISRLWFQAYYLFSKPIRKGWYHVSTEIFFWKIYWNIAGSKG